MNECRVELTKIEGNKSMPLDTEKHKIYELVYKLKCLDFEFVRTNWKVFNSEAEAEAYGRKEQDELNGGLPPEEKANDGYCYIFWYAHPVEKVDDYPISLGDEKFC